FLPANETWVVEVGGEVAGYVAFTAEWLNHLFVHPDHQGRGIGPVLLARVMADGRPKQLWTFQKNARARRFYEQRGFTAVRFTQGRATRSGSPMCSTPGRQGDACNRRALGYVLGS